MQVGFTCWCRLCTVDTNKKTRSSEAGKRAIDNQTDRCRSQNDYVRYTIPQAPAKMRGEQQYVLEIVTIVANLLIVGRFVNCKAVRWGCSKGIGGFSRPEAS